MAKILLASTNEEHNKLTYTNKYLKKKSFTNSTISNNIIKINNISTNISTLKRKKRKPIFTKIIMENLYYKK